MGESTWLVARSTDKDRRIYLALREIFTVARQCACEFKPMGWSLYATFTDPGVHVCTEYENEDYRMRIRMDSFQETGTHMIRFLAYDEASARGQV